MAQKIHIALLICVGLSACSDKVPSAKVLRVCSSTYFDLYVDGAGRRYVGNGHEVMKPVAPQAADAAVCP